jgi:hypothetical protein
MASTTMATVMLAPRPFQVLFAFVGTFRRLASPIPTRSRDAGDNHCVAMRAKGGQEDPARLAGTNIPRILCPHALRACPLRGASTQD